MNTQPEQARHIIRFCQGLLSHVEDTIAMEHPVTIKINGEEFVTLVCTPEFIEDMVIGYLASEGIIRHMQDIQHIWTQEEEGFVHVTTKRWNPLHRQLFAKRYVTSCCGSGRHSFVYVNDARTAKHTHGEPIELRYADCFRLMNTVLSGTELFQHTGGVHTAALCSNKDVLLTRSDIGRHNALDKILGHYLRQGIPPEHSTIVLSGRISSEILLKASKLGAEIVLSKSAPTSLAIDLADELGITAVGFIRADVCNVYSHPERITAD
ncbi:formate dehydrogenase accessory sulfurtransferase FdhD [Paenibacillus massiliensis]|uniref:formate dehydrogenase accessory sulfurtransferase FdhD n=1 Tax=Paenibacillus massiliensis TaxID=225917 RepID=UPI00041DD55B|nr:formate dehydrogenase accessory sulfurtransferase FdhD [Paenibacillus massiliensis]